MKFERDKTDASLDSVRKATEAHIDSGVTDKREIADESIESLRLESDGKIEKARSSPGYNLAAEQRESDQRLMKERERSDSAIDSERELLDIATARERDIKSSLESKFLSDERGKTDENLSSERVETDAAYLVAVSSLTTRDEFIAIVSHDLKNPLGAASSCASMLLEDYDHPPEVKKWIEFIGRNVDASLRMIGDLLDVERISENKMEMTLAPHAIGPIVRDASETFALAIAAKDIELVVDIENLETIVTCDPDRITQVFFNLIGNAIKFTPAHGKITLEARRFEDRVRFAVTDTGCGMPLDRLDKIFERSAQLSSRDRSGLGLGLYIAQNIVQGHGSTLKVESTELVGTRMSFDLPIKASANPAVRR